MFNNPHGKYVYDALYRLTQAEGREKRNLGGAPEPGEIGIQPVPSGQNTAVRGYTEQYNYDELGNMLQIIHTSTRTQDSWNKYYHYTPAFTNNFLLSTSTDNVAPTNPDYTYDAHGNMLQMPQLSSMSWDFADRLQSANIGGNAMVYFTYNANGERVRKVRVNASGRRWERIYLGAFEMYRIVNGNGNLRFERQTLHISDNQSRVALVDTLTIDDGNTVANPVSVQRYQLNNHLESASLELDENADIISYEEFYPFGSTSYRAGRSNSEVNAKRYRYVGKEKDNETGLYYYGARYYASWLARFVSVDPLKDKYIQLSPYQYAGNEPIGDVDIDGLEGKKTPVLPIVKSDATNIDPLRGRKLQVDLFIKQRQEKITGLFTDPAKSPNATFIGPNTDTRSFKEKQRQLRKFEAEQKIQQLKKDVSAISPFVGGGQGLGTGFASNTGTGLVIASLFVSTAGTLKGLSAGQKLLQGSKQFTIGFSLNATTQFVVKRDLNQIDFADAAFSGVSNLITKKKGANFLVDAAASGTVDFTLENGFETVFTGEKDEIDFLIDFGSGVAAGFIGEKAGSIIDANQSRAVLKSAFKPVIKRGVKEVLTGLSEKAEDKLEKAISEDELKEQGFFKNPN